MSSSGPGVLEAPPKADAKPIRLNRDVAYTVSRYGPIIMRDAVRYSASSEDAEDAYQRTLELLLTKAPSDDPKELVPWLRVVVRNQAFEIARERPDCEVDFPPEKLEHLAADTPDPHEAAEDAAEIEMGFEALGRLTQPQITCLLAQAEGLNYSEIAERTGFSMRKVSRSLERGRHEFANRFNSIAEGEECRRMRPLIWKVLAADADAAIELRPHLRHCLGCRSMLRAYESAPRDLAVLLPPALVLSSGDGGSIFARAESFVQALADRVAVHLMGAERWAEAAGTKKAVAIVAVTATAAGGGVAVERGVDRAVKDGSPTSASSADGAGTGYSRPAMYDAVKLPPERRAKTKKRKKQTQVDAVAPAPVPEPAPAQAPPPVPIDDGSAEFAPEARSAP